MSCCIGAFHACYHTRMGVYHHEMGIKEGGKLAMLAAAGPMGLGCIAYALCCDRRPGTIVVTDINQDRLDRAEELFRQQAIDAGIELHLVNTSGMEDPATYLKSLVGGTGYDDVFSFAPVSAVVELASDIAGRDCCLNFFAGPTDTKFSGKLNYYDIHYNSTHVMGTTGGNTDDLVESLKLSEAGLLNPAVMVTHVGGRPCGCGHRGCYERYASTTALLQAARKFRPELENARQLFDAAPADPNLRRVIRQWIREIVEGLCTLTYIFSPDCIILGEKGFCVVEED